MRGRGVGRTISVIQQEVAVDLVNASGDVALALGTPSPGARVVSFTFRTTSVGTGTGTHTLTLEVGSGAAGRAIAEPIVVTSPGELTDFGEGVGLSQPEAAAVVLLDLPGSVLQIKNVEGGTVSDGVIGTLNIVWQI